MNAIKNKMIRDAQSRFSRIFPVASRKNLSECFTEEGDMLIFWFNTEDLTTHTLIEAI